MSLTADKPFADALASLTSKEMTRARGDHDREAAAIEVDSEDGYEGCHYASISIVYWRPMTDDERAERARKEEEGRKQEERRARQMYEQLRQRFGD